MIKSMKWPTLYEHQIVRVMMSHHKFALIPRKESNWKGMKCKKTNLMKWDKYICRREDVGAKADEKRKDCQESTADALCKEKS